MYKKLLVYLDGTPFTESVLDHVIEIARAEESEVILVTVLPKPEPEIVGGVMVSSIDQVVERSAARAEDYLRGISWHLQLYGIKSRRVVRFGDRAKEISECAKLHEVDLIVMPSHNRQGLDRIIHGSVSEKVMKSVPMPMLVLNAA